MKNILSFQVPFTGFSTRDKILADGIGILYPHSYWHAEVYYDKTPIIEHGNPPFRCGVLFACNKNK